MSQIILATVVDGVLKPDVPLALPSMTRVRLIVEPITVEVPGSSEDAVLSEVERIWEEIDVTSAGSRANRDELHGR
jgi:predicted DNA-binding antitoxin AbrB/MazE fold protein